MKTEEEILAERFPNAGDPRRDPHFVLRSDAAKVQDLLGALLTATNNVAWEINFLREELRNRS